MTSDPNWLMAAAHFLIGVAAVIGAVQGWRAHPKLNRIERQTNGELIKLQHRIRELED